MKFRSALMAFSFACGIHAPAIAQDVKFVGTWEGFSQPIYSKLVFHDDGSLTYCSVQNCRAIQCEKKVFSGAIQDSFAFSDTLREWTFEWTSPEEIQALMSVKDGGMAFAVYAPEGPEDRFDLMSLPAPVN